MGIAEELAKLKALRDEGALTGPEYAAAKRKLLAEDSIDPDPAADEAGGVLAEMFTGRRRTLGEAANRYVSFQIVMAVVAIVIFLIFASQMNSRMGPGF